MIRSLSDALSASHVEDRRKAARALLRRPLLRASSQADEYRLVRKHEAELRAWFDLNTGWRLVVDSEVARLVKVAATTDDASHPARDTRSKLPFTRRRYVLTCLALATLERADAQITLGRLAGQVVMGAADPELGVDFTLTGREERSDLVAVVRLLLDLGVLSKVAGEEDAFVRDTGDVLYDVERRVLATMLATRRGPSTMDSLDLAELTAEVVPDSDELRNRAIRRRLTRQLLDEPVLYYDELDETELAYLTRQRAALTRQVSELTGLVAEVRAEGIAMIDPADDLTDVRMPESGTEGHVTLLIAEYLAAQGDEAVPISALHDRVRVLAQEHRSYWRRNATEPGAESELVEQALTRLVALHLVHRDHDQVSARPALARYALAEPTITTTR
ncbi:TIGR02678 family protein [Lentzea californiensis]|uniref:TIGR02678 family protein n=1 Tax=Lentzea californiensis TaxID=438851 RepID=UPI0021650534|nr:TIGR02678 family protein [Lentzea californiensis]MCR3749618.1 TIGR02678 family protein [Lentzea californiensis]